MGTVLLDVSMSLDGFIAGLDDGAGPVHDWYFAGDVECDRNPELRTSAASRDVLNELFDRTGALVVGRTTFDLTDGWGGNHPLPGVPVVVVTHEPPEVVPAGATPFTFVTEGVDRAVEVARQLAGDKDVVVMGGASIAEQCLRAGLLDEIELHVAPLLLGDGIRLFERSVAQVRLEPVRTIPAPDVTHLRFAVVARDERVTARAELLPEEGRAGSADPLAQAEVILRESDERSEHPVAVERRTSDEATPPV